MGNVRGTVTPYDILEEGVGTLGEKVCRLVREKGVLTIGRAQVEGIANAVEECLVGEGLGFRDKKSREGNGSHAKGCKMEGLSAKFGQLSLVR